MKKRNFSFLIALILLLGINTLSLKKALNTLSSQRTLDDFKDNVHITKEETDEKTTITITMERKGEEEVPEMIADLFEKSNNIVMDELKNIELEDKQKPEEPAEKKEEP